MKLWQFVGVYGAIDPETWTEDPERVCIFHPTEHVRRGMAGKTPTPFFYCEGCDAVRGEIVLEEWTRRVAA